MTSAAWSLLLLLSWELAARSDAPSDSRAEPAYSGTVAGAEARFVFPVERRARWEWYQPTTDDDSLEYTWNVEVVRDGRRYQFGFFLYKFPGSPPTRGSLATLLKAGQFSIVEETGKIVTDKTVKVVAKPGHLVIIVRDPEAKHRLFADRPPTAKLSARMPDGLPAPHETAIRYLDK